MANWGIGADNTVFTMISGVPQWLPVTTLHTADNGITLTANNFQLGGPLVEATTNINMSGNTLRVYSGDLKLGVIGAPILTSLEVATSNGDMYFGDLLIYGIGVNAAQITLKAGGGSSEWALDAGNTHNGVGNVGDVLINKGSGVLEWDSPVGLNPTNVITTSAVNYTVLGTETHIQCDCSSNDVTLDWTSAATTDTEITVQKIDASLNSAIVDPNLAETINGAPTASTSTQWNALEVYSDGSNLFWK